MAFNIDRLGFTVSYRRNNLELGPPSLNREGVLCYLSTGVTPAKYYCGRTRPKGERCRCGYCDGVCGPDNGCPCDACDGTTFDLTQESATESMHECVKELEKFYEGQQQQQHTKNQGKEEGEGNTKASSRKVPAPVPPHFLNSQKPRNYYTRVVTKLPVSERVVLSADKLVTKWCPTRGGEGQSSSAKTKQQQSYDLVQLGPRPLSCYVQMNSALYDGATSMKRKELPGWGTLPPEGSCVRNIEGQLTWRTYTGEWYCGKWIGYSRRDWYIDGHCGPSNGVNCPACRLISHVVKEANGGMEHTEPVLWRGDAPSHLLWSPVYNHNGSKAFPDSVKERADAGYITLRKCGLIADIASYGMVYAVELTSEEEVAILYARGWAV